MINTKISSSFASTKMAQKGETTMGWNTDFNLKGARKRFDYLAWPGFVYLFALGNVDHYKVGNTRHWKSRLATIKVGDPYCHPVCVAYAYNYKLTEVQVHLLLQNHLVSGEVYKLDRFELNDIHSFLSYKHQDSIERFKRDSEAGLWPFPKPPLSDGFGILENWNLSDEFDHRLMYLPNLYKE